MPDIKIWGASTPRSFRPIWVAEELELSYEHFPIGPRTGETQTPEYTRMNRKQKIPFMADGSVALSESVAICRYLVTSYPNEQLSSPGNLFDKAKEDEWCCYVYGELDETSLYVMRRHGELAEIYGSEEGVVRAAADYLKRHLSVLAEHLEGRDYLMDHGFGLPDILLMSCLDWADFYQVELPEALAKYRDRIAQRPAYIRAMQINYPNLFKQIVGGA